MPRKATVAIEFDAEKLRAARFYAGKKDAVPEPELIGCLQRFYEKYVPAATREYIESAAEAEPPLRAPRSAMLPPACAQAGPQEAREGGV
jgi:hypothetical protein